MTVVRNFGYKERRRQIRQSRTNNRQWHLVSAGSVRGGQYREHLPTSARAGQNNGMDFFLRNLHHLTHVPERGLKVLVGRRFGLISGHLDHCRHHTVSG